MCAVRCGTLDGVAEKGGKGVWAAAGCLFTACCPKLGVVLLCAGHVLLVPGENYNFGVACGRWGVPRGFGGGRGERGEGVAVV